MFFPRGNETLQSLPYLKLSSSFLYQGIWDKGSVMVGHHQQPTKREQYCFLIFLMRFGNFLRGLCTIHLSRQAKRHGVASEKLHSLC